ncbi:Beta/gamma crystallin domain-containing protein 3 [Sesbania bispinosa]|nr:Beta/gamma crystallin domain-containing protein 3 [Sesbania bispinosa]
MEIPTKRGAIVICQGLHIPGDGCDRHERAHLGHSRLCKSMSYSVAFTICPEEPTMGKVRVDPFNVFNDVLDFPVELI